MTKPNHAGPTNEAPASDAPPTDDDLLDEALEETFPASDPIAVHPERKDKPAER
jgi:hypothetical protein